MASRPSLSLSRKSPLKSKKAAGGGGGAGGKKAAAVNANTAVHSKVPVPMRLYSVTVYQSKYKSGLVSYLPEICRIRMGPRIPIPVQIN
jgi:hypothetical protein